MEIKYQVIWSFPRGGHWSPLIQSVLLPVLALRTAAEKLEDWTNNWISQVTGHLAGAVRVPTGVFWWVINLKDGRSKRLANRGENGWSSSSSEASIHRFLIWRNMVTSGSQVFRQLHQVRQSLSAGASGSRVKRRRPLTIDHHDLWWSMLVC